MTIREELKRMGYDITQQADDPLCSGLSLDDEVCEEGLMIHENMCIPGRCGWAVHVNVQQKNDCWIASPWISLWLKPSQSIRFPHEYSFEWQCGCRSVNEWNLR